jgi:hypothetical protein
LKKSSNGVKALNRILDPILNYERFLIGCMERL